METRVRPRPGTEVEVTVDALAYGGNGVARLDAEPGASAGAGGYVLFVGGAIPGDTVRAVVTKSKRSYGEARTLEVLEPSPDRIEPRADHPGAPWQVIPYESQLAIKHEQVREALDRLGHLEGYELEPIVPAVEQWRYRNKLEFSFGTDARGELVCGFHAPGRFDEILPVEDCLLQSERGNAAREQVLAWARAQGLPAWDRRTQQGILRNLVIREGRRTGQLQVRLVTSEAEIDASSLDIDADGVFWTRIDQVGESTSGGRTVHVRGAKALEERLGDLTFAISPEAFFQTNSEMAEVLYGIAVDYAALGGVEKVFDLYCGIGTIALSLSSRAREVVGVEIAEAAVADAISNARRNGVVNARFFAGDIRLAMRDLVAEAGRPDVCVVDPPRAGLSQKVVRRIIEAGPKRMVYVSCNPTTLAPNAAQMVEAGYRLVKVRPVDMFPQTPHIECVALLERTDAYVAPDRDA